MDRSTQLELGAHWRAFALVAVLLFGVTSYPKAGPQIAALMIVGVLLVGGAAWFASRGAIGSEQGLRLVGILTIVVFLSTTLPALNVGYFDSFPAWFRVSVGSVVLITGAIPWMRTPIGQVIVGAVLIICVSVAAVLHIVENPDPGTDVVYGHQAAATVLADGRNPYSDALFRDTSPRYASKGEIVGYAYPPITMLPYVAAEGVWDGRLVSVAAMSLVLSLILWLASRRSSSGLLLLGVAVTYPMLGAMYVHGWTEPLQLLLLVLAALAFARWKLGGVILGLAVASKQYMILALIPMLTVPESNRWRRLAVTAMTGLVVTLPFFLWNPAAFWNALVGVQLVRVQRLDTSSIAALGAVLPIGVALVVTAGVAIVLGRQVQSIHGVLLTQASALAVYFLLSPNTFRNYWFLVAYLLLAAVAMDRPIKPADAEWGIGRESITAEDRS